MRLLGLLAWPRGAACDTMLRARRGACLLCYYILHSEPSYSAQTQRSNPAFSRGRLSAQNPHTVLSRICMKLDIKTVH